MTRPLLAICLLSASQIRNVQSLDPIELYLKPQYTQEGEYIKEYLQYNDVGEEEQKLLPRSLHVAFKIITTDFNLTDVARGSAEYENIKNNATTSIENKFNINIKELKVLDIRYKTGNLRYVWKHFQQVCIFRKHRIDSHDSLIFGFIRLDNEEDTKAVESLMKEYFLNGSIGDLSVSHGMIALSVLLKGLVSF